MPIRNRTLKRPAKQTNLRLNKNVCRSKKKRNKNRNRNQNPIKNCKVTAPITSTIKDRSSNKQSKPTLCNYLKKGIHFN